MSERFVVTGALGCIGTWVVRQLVREGVHVTALDIGTNDHRWRLVMSREEISHVHLVEADITNLGALEGVLDASRVTHILHLAALQVPFCKEDPSLGAQVNVVGTVNVFEAIKRRREKIGHVVYASSVAAYGAGETGPASGGTATSPGTLYGVFKRANEGIAHVYWDDDSVSSIGLRPHTVFGPGRDQGLTSAPTTAMLSAASGRSYRIPFGGRLQMQYAPDVARVFIAAARSCSSGAAVHNLSGQAVHMSSIVSAIRAAAPDSAGAIDFDDVVLPFPEEVDAGSLEGAVGPIDETPLADAVDQTVSRFRELIADGVIDPRQGA